MQLARIVFAGALLFGVGCEPSEEGELATGQRIDPTKSMDSIDHDSDGVADENQVSNYAIDEIMGTEVRTIQGEECTLDIARLTDEEVEELQDILNTAIVDDELVFARLPPEQVARVQAILTSAIVM